MNSNIVTEIPIMIQFIHVYLNITILYQGDAMQISNLVSQYNNSVTMVSRFWQDKLKAKLTKDSV